jgi:hypothetical protein
MYKGKLIWNKSVNPNHEPQSDDTEMSPICSLNHPLQGAWLGELPILRLSADWLALLSPTQRRKPLATKIQIQCYRQACPFQLLATLILSNIAYTYYILKTLVF